MCMLVAVTLASCHEQEFSIEQPRWSSVIRADEEDEVNVCAYLHAYVLETNAGHLNDIPNAT